MNINGLNQTEPTQIDGSTGTELPEGTTTEDETQPVEIDATVKLTESSETPAVSEPLPDSVGGTETSPSSEPAASTQAYTEPKMITRSAALWLAVGGMLLSFILAVVFSLGLLAVVNGGLRFARPVQVQSISSQLNGLNAQTVSIQREVDNLTARIITLEGLDARVATVEKDTEVLQNDVTAAATALTSLDSQVGELSLQVATVESQIAELDTRTTRFQRFLDGLRDLLGGLIK
jgi:prefoldin subunit 5